MHKTCADLEGGVGIVPWKFNIFFKIHIPVVKLPKLAPSFP